MGKIQKLIIILSVCLTFFGCEVANPTEEEPIVEESNIEKLAKEYDHLAWYLDESPTKVINGVAYDLNDLKKQYGDLYRFVEPLTEEEVNYRFQYLAEYFDTLNQKGKIEEYPGGIFDTTTEIFTVFNRIHKQNYELIANTDDSLLKQFSSYYEYSESLERYMRNIPNTMKVNDEYNNYQLISIISDIPFEDKNWFVRDYMFAVDTILKSYERNNDEPNFVLPIKQ